MKVTVIAHPNARKAKVEGDLLGTLHVYVKEPPLEGRANIAVIEELSKYFNTKKNAIVLVSGEKSKMKIFEITSL